MIFLVTILVSTFVCFVQYLVCSFVGAVIIEILAKKWGFDSLLWVLLHTLIVLMVVVAKNFGIWGLIPTSILAVNFLVLLIKEGVVEVKIRRASQKPVTVSPVRRAPQTTVLAYPESAVHSAR